MDFDSPWKEILEKYFPEFMQFFFPNVFSEINWKKHPVFLDKELQKVVRGASFGIRFVDKLVQVWQKGGTERWVLVHIEVQRGVEKDFAKRMYVYNYRLFDKFHRSVASFAILGDENPVWKPNVFSSDLWGCKASLTFPLVKILEYDGKSIPKEFSKNPFRVVVKAHLEAIKTKKNAKARYLAKITLAKSLYKAEFSKQQIIDLFRFIDWILTLPKDLDISFDQEIFQFEEELHMPYVTSVERSGFARGKAEGKAEGKAKGEAKGKAEGKAEVARKMLKKGFPVDQIRELTGLTIKAIAKLQD